LVDIEKKIFYLLSYRVLSSGAYHQLL
jgi:hypothetical protein